MTPHSSESVVRSWLKRLFGVEPEEASSRRQHDRATDHGPETGYERSVREAVEDVEALRRRIMDGSQRTMWLPVSAPPAAWPVDLPVDDSSWIGPEDLLTATGALSMPPQPGCTSACTCASCSVPETSFANTVRKVEDDEARWLEILALETEACGDPWAAAVDVFGASPPDAVSVGL